MKEEIKIIEESNVLTPLNMELVRGGNCSQCINCSHTITQTCPSQQVTVCPSHCTQCSGGSCNANSGLGGSLISVF